MGTSLRCVRALVAGAILAGALTSSSARAEESDAARAEASARFKRALELFDENNFAAALVELRRAYELTHNYRVLYNIGQVCFQINDYACALEALEGYASAGGAEIPAARTAEVQRDIAILRPRVGRVTITTSVSGVEIAVDDVARGVTPLAGPIALSAGRHRVSATKPGMHPVIRQIDVAGADAVAIDVVLLPVESTPAPAAPPTAFRSDEPSRWTTLSWVGVGAAGVLGAAAIVTGAVAVRQSNDLADAQYVMTPDEDATSLRTRVKTLALVTDVLAVAAIATLGTTLALTLTHTPPHAQKGSAAIEVGPGGILVRGRFR
jgi:hypothetical protein